MSNIVYYKIKEKTTDKFISSLGSQSMYIYGCKYIQPFYTSPKGKIWKNKASAITAFGVLVDNLQKSKRINELINFELIECVMIEKPLDIKSIFSDILKDKKLDTFLNTLNK